MAAKCLRAASWAVVLFLAAGCEKIAEPEGVGQPPQAAAGGDLQATAGAQTHLDGRVSADAEGGALQYAWIQVSGPVAAGIRNADAAQASVVLAEAGEYVFRLTVTNGSGLSGTDEVRVVAVAAVGDGGGAQGAVDVPPRASAGLDLQVVVGSAAGLDGSGSGDAESDVLQYAWVQISGPVPVGIRGADAVQAVVVPEQPGEYAFRLTVTDGSGLSGTDEVRVVAAAAPGGGGESTPPKGATPQASAGPDLEVTAGAETGLDGSGSGGAPGSVLQYAWVQIGGPALVGIQGADAARATVVLPQEGEYLFRLTVTDADGLSATDEVRVVAGAASGPEPTPAYGSLAVVGAPVPAGAVRVEYQLTAADLDTLRGEMHIGADRTASAVIEQVRPGPERRIEVYVYESDGRVERLGGTVVEVREGERVELRIELAPLARAVGQLDIEGVVQPLPGDAGAGDWALSLDGNGDFMRIGPNPGLVFDPASEDYTVEMWLVVEAVPVDDGGWQAVVNPAGQAAAAPFALEIRNSGEAAALYGGSHNHEQDEVAVGPVQTMLPVHAALVFRNGFMLSYWNGRLTSSVERRGGQVVAPGEYFVGAATGVAGEPAHFLKGQVDELRLWRRALSRQEIRTGMAGGLGGAEPGLVGYWSFDNLTGEGLVPDLSGHGLDGALTGDAHLAPPLVPR